MNRIYQAVFSILLITYMGSFPLYAQIITLSTTEMDFNTVDVGTALSLGLTIENNSDEPINIIDINTYDPAFALSDTAFIIPASDFVVVDVVFEPDQNIYYNTELVVVSDVYEGNEAMDLRGAGRFPNPYYSSTYNLFDENLKTALQNLIDGHTSLGYNLARDRMFMEIDNQLVNGGGASQNTLETAYTGRLVEGYSSRSDAQTNYNVNTEHTYPQSQFSSAEPMQSDLYHLFVTDAVANSVRGNLPFGPVASPDWTEGGSKKDNFHFEPRDEQKGRTARAMLYFLTRYGNLNSFVDAEQEAVLKEWHLSFLPDSAEKNRNEAIFDEQNNRNPFIDYPQLSRRIQSFISISEPLIENTVDITTTSLDFGNVALYGDYQFELVVVATGNQTVFLSDYELSSEDFAFNGIDNTIEAGESGRISIRFNPSETGPYEEFLRFNTSSANYPAFTLPIAADVVATGVEEEETGIDLQMYPQPATDWVVVELLKQIKINLSIIDLQGREFLTWQDMGSGKHVLDISSLSTGHYFLKCRSAEGMEVFHLIKY